MITLGYIKHFALAHAEIAYMLIILGVIIEGEIVVILAGIFAHLGSISFTSALIATVLGGALKSIVGYGLGYLIHSKWSHSRLLNGAERRVHYFLPRFSSRPFWSVFASRFLILGLHWFTLIYAGYKRVLLRTFVRAETSSLIVWSVSMLSLGYFFSYTALSVSRDVRKFLGIILLCFIGFFILEKIIAFCIELFSTSKASE
jgi:membrane protein DedA with SNARE-associated domain